MPGTNYAEANDVRKLSVAEISKLTNAQLKLAIASLLGVNDKAAELTNRYLMNQLHKIKEEIKGLRPLRQEVEQLKEENNGKSYVKCLKFFITSNFSQNKLSAGKGKNT